MTPTALLPQEIAPFDRRQAELSLRHLGHAGEALMAYFLALRAEVDADLAPRFPAAAGKPYPYGRCEEITRELYARLLPRLRNPGHPVEQALLALGADGGIVQTVWGVLREQYFQNALQFGGLYVDVSNDTVFVEKPKIEILPVEHCGLVAVRDLAHFRATAKKYWNADIYVNSMAPTLAPLLPMVSYSPGKLLPCLQSACDYMIALMCRDGFSASEEWLREGPAAPPDVAAAVMAATPEDLRPWSDDGRAEAVLACQRACAAGGHQNSQWRDARVNDYLRLLARCVSSAT
jgi:hypothetical protein